MVIGCIVLPVFVAYLLSSAIPLNVYHTKPRYLYGEMGLRAVGIIAEDSSLSLSHLIARTPSPRSPRSPPPPPRSVFNYPLKPVSLYLSLSLCCGAVFDKLHTVAYLGVKVAYVPSQAIPCAYVGS